MAVAGWMRAADSDREHTVEILRQAYAEGRLEPAELDERTGAAFQARTIGELRGLLADIPRRSSAACLPSDQPWRPVVPRTRRGPAQWSPRAQLLLLLTAVVCLVIGAATRNPAAITLAVSAGLGAAALRRG